jgi:hypothetical protein
MMHALAHQSQQFVSSHVVSGIALPVRAGAAAAGTDRGSAAQGSRVMMDSIVAAAVPAVVFAL